MNGGDDIYGASLTIPCQKTQSELDICELSVVRDTPTSSSVSSTPKCVCFCDSNGYPQCETLKINQQYYPGEQFNISAVFVGGDFGTTIDTVHTNFMVTKFNATPSQTPLHFNFDAEYSQTISSRIKCSELTFSVYTSHTLSNTVM